MRLVSIALAQVSELFKFKESKQILDPFPGYTDDQWGIKAHNRPWVEHVGAFSEGQKIIEVGGAYSTLPKALAERYNLEAWVGDDFGDYNRDDLWKRWGNPNDLPIKNPGIKYVFEPFGIFSKSYPEKYFDRIFSISTLEHIPAKFRVNVFKDMNRCLAPGGLQIHSIDINIPPITRSGLLNIIGDKFKFLTFLSSKFQSEISSWLEIMSNTGIEIDIQIPNSLQLYDRKVLVESPDVVYRFYPPMNQPKIYNPTASLLVIIEN